MRISLELPGTNCGMNIRTSESSIQSAWIGARRSTVCIGLSWELVFQLLFRLRTLLTSESACEVTIFQSTTPITTSIMTTSVVPIIIIY